MTSADYDSPPGSLTEVVNLPNGADYTSSVKFGENMFTRRLTGRAVLDARLHRV